MSREEDIKLIKKNGFKAFKPERHSYEDENGQKWLQCCRCMKHQKVDIDTAKVTCGRCACRRPGGR